MLPVRSLTSTLQAVLPDFQMFAVLKILKFHEEIFWGSTMKILSKFRRQIQLFHEGIERRCGDDAFTRPSLNPLHL